MEELKIPRELYNPIRNFAFISPSNEVIIKGQNLHRAGREEGCISIYNARSRCRSKIMVRSRVSGLFSNPQYKTDRLEAVTSTGNLEINTKLVIDASALAVLLAEN